MAAQDVPLRLILIDNASTDGGAALAVAACRRLGVSPAPCPRDRASIRWTLAERLVYALAARHAGIGSSTVSLLRGCARGA